MASRGYGRGSVFQRKADGRWIGKITRRGEIEASFSGATQAEVEAKLDDWLTEHRPDRMAEGVPRTRLPREDYLIAARARGSHTQAEWSEYLATTEGRCHYCRRKAGIAPHKDHRTPVSRGGSDAIANLVLACADCNMAKGPMTEAEFMAYAADTEFFGKPRRRAVRNMPILQGSR